MTCSPCRARHVQPSAECANQAHLDHARGLRPTRSAALCKCQCIRLWVAGDTSPLTRSHYHYVASTLSTLRIRSAPPSIVAHVLMCCVPAVLRCRSPSRGTVCNPLGGRIAEAGLGRLGFGLDCPSAVLRLLCPPHNAPSHTLPHTMPRASVWQSPRPRMPHTPRSSHPPA